MGNWYSIKFDKKKKKQATMFFCFFFNPHCLIRDTLDILLCQEERNWDVKLNHNAMAHLQKTSTLFKVWNVITRVQREVEFQWPWLYLEVKLQRGRAAFSTLGISLSMLAIKHYLLRNYLSPPTKKTHNKEFILQSR